MSEFVAFEKIPRLNRMCVVSEKLDGTNACIVIEEVYLSIGEAIDASANYVSRPASEVEGAAFKVYAQSRKRVITPEYDNYGFAAWVRENAFRLALALGVGRHYGEWWGQGINRGYGLSERRFSLFNVKRWETMHFPAYQLDNVFCVPVLAHMPFDTVSINNVVRRLETHGSYAAPGYMNPEGVIVFHDAAQQLFKVTCKDDEKPKGSNE